MLNLERALPHPSLRDLIDTYYYLDVDLPEGMEINETLLPELPNIRVQIEGNWEFSICDGPFSWAPDAMVMGFTNHPYGVRLRGKSKLFGIGLKPLGWLRLLGISADELSDQVVDLRAIMGPGADALISVICQGGDINAISRATDCLLMSMVQREHSRSAQIIARFETAMSGDIQLIRVDDLAENMELSVRQVERSSRQLYGCAPKLLLRKHRFMSMLTRARSNGCLSNWLDAADETLYDQSHYIREFKRFTGETPTNYMRSANMLQNTIVNTLATLPERRQIGVSMKLDVPR